MTAGGSGVGAPTYLRTEYLTDPIGLDETRPRFSWLVSDDRRGARSSAYQVLVASDPALLDRDLGDLWDSGTTSSTATAQVAYEGTPLRSFALGHWKVRTWDAEGRPSAWSAPARFGLGPLTATDWRGAKLIRSGLVGDPRHGAPSPHFRTEFDLDGEVVRARLYITAFGLYVASVNGQHVSDDVLRPGWTDYRKRVPFQAYEVTDLVHSGRNAIGIVLGDGWYCGQIVNRRQIWGDRPQVIAKLIVEVAGGPALTIGTGAGWKTAAGPIRSSDLYHGEVYDARLELPGWDCPGYADADWDAAEEYEMALGWGPAQIVAAIAPPVRRTRELDPVQRTEHPGAVRFDLGQNISGWVRLRVVEPAGTSIRLRFAEALSPDGTLYVENLHGARATDVYIAKGAPGGEEFEPTFTYHGFRHVEVDGLSAPDRCTVQGIVVHSDLPETGRFECSDAALNRLYENIVWSQRANFFEVPTDCPQRAERLGWTGDIQVFARTAMLNMDAAAFLTKYSQDLRDGQIDGGPERGTYPGYVPSTNTKAGGAGWADAGVIVPMLVHEQYGDVRVLERHYASMLAYVAFLERARQGLVPGTFAGFADWLALDPEPLVVDDLEEDLGPGYADHFGGTPREYVWLAFEALSTRLVGRAAEILGDGDRARLLSRRWQELRREFEASYVADDGHLRVRTQTGYALALRFDLLTTAAQREAAIADLAANVTSTGHLQTGFLGTPHLLPALADNGRADLAYRLLMREETPGWLYQVRNGATTMWERWDAWSTEAGFRPHRMNSLNHYAYGAVGEWLFSGVAGIRLTPGTEGYRSVTIRPEIGGGLTWAKAAIDTVRGTIWTQWRLEGALLALRVGLPPTTTASLRIPARDPGTVSERGIALARVDGVANIRPVDGAVECDLVAGSYEFLVRRLRRDEE